jgi:hypothetical protein
VNTVDQSIGSRPAVIKGSGTSAPSSQASDLIPTGYFLRIVFWFFHHVFELGPVEAGFPSVSKASHFSATPLPLILPRRSMSFVINVTLPISQLGAVGSFRTNADGHHDGPSSQRYPGVFREISDWLHTRIKRASLVGLLCSYD